MGGDRLRLAAAFAAAGFDLLPREVAVSATTIYLARVDVGGETYLATAATAAAARRALLWRVAADKRHPATVGDVAVARLRLGEAYRLGEI